MRHCINEIDDLSTTSRQHDLEVLNIVPVFTYADPLYHRNEMPTHFRFLTEVN